MCLLAHLFLIPQGVRTGWVRPSERESGEEGGGRFLNGVTGEKPCTETVLTSV